MLAATHVVMNSACNYAGCCEICYSSCACGLGSGGGSEALSEPLCSASDVVKPRATYIAVVHSSVHRIHQQMLSEVRLR